MPASIPGYGVGPIHPGMGYGHHHVLSMTIRAETSGLVATGAFKLFPPGIQRMVVHVIQIMGPAFQIFCLVTGLAVIRSMAVCAPLLIDLGLLSMHRQPCITVVLGFQLFEIFMTLFTRPRCKIRLMTCQTDPHCGQMGDRGNIHFGHTIMANGTCHIPDQMIFVSKHLVVYVHPWVGLGVIRIFVTIFTFLGSRLTIVTGHTNIHLRQIVVCTRLALLHRTMTGDAIELHFCMTFMGENQVPIRDNGQYSPTETE